MKKNLILMASLLFVFLCSSFCFSEEPSKVSVSGKFVRTSASGLPLTDIQVKVTGTKEITIKTDRNGNYIAYNLPAGGNYTITPFKAGFFFSPQTKTYTNLTASKINENFAVSERTYSISGKIIVGGKPSKGEVVMINTRAVKYFTNDDGEYFIDNLPYEGPYIVTVESNKFVFEPFKVEQLDQDIVYNFEKSIKARGYVTSLGMGIPNVEIAVNNKRYKTDATGFYEISGLAANGSYILAVINTEMNPDPKFVELKKMTQDRDNVNFSLSGSIAGTIQTNGKPFVGAVVKIISNDQSEETKTDKNGNYKINKLGLYRDYTISISSSGYVFAPNDRTIKKLAGQLESQNFTASIQKWKIYGTVMIGKTPAKDVEVSIDGFSKFIKTDINGGYSFDNLSYGKDYTVSVRAKQMKFVESKKIIKNMSENTEVNFKGLLSISGKVTINGQPLENAKILYDFKSFVLTGKDGNYTVKDLMPEQVYTIEVSSDNYEFTPSSFTSEQLEDSLTDKNFIVVIDPKIKEKQEKLAQEEAKKKALEEEKLRKEELKKIALQEKLAQEELKKKVLEEERLRKEELKRIELQQKEQDRLRQEELKKIALQEKLAQEEAKKKAQAQEKLKKIDSPEKSAGENKVNTISKDKDELQIIALQEELAKEEAKKKALKEEKLRKEELKNIALQEKLAQEEAKKKALKEEKLRKEELKNIALQEKLAQEEAKKKALEQEKLRKEELKKIALQEKLAQEEAKKKALKEEKLRKEELKKIALQEKLVQEEAKKKALEQEKSRKEELEKIALREKLANDELKDKGVKDKVIRTESINKDELQIIALQAEFAKEDTKKKAKEEEKSRKEELKKIALQEKLAQEEAKKKAKEEERLRKEELKKIALQEELAKEEAKKKALEQEQLRKEELKKIALQEELAKEEAKNKALEQEQLRKEELKKIALQEELAKEEAKKKALEQEQLRKEELKKIALQEELAQEEAKNKALEEERARNEELKRIELNEKINQEQKKRLEMQAKIALQEKELQEKESQEENLQKTELQNKIDQEKVKNRELEQERLRKEELARIEIQQQEQDRLRQEELKKIELQNKLNKEQEILAEEAKQKALEEERLRKEELRKIDEQKKEQQRLEKEEAEKKEIEERLRKEELKKIALQEKLAQEEAKKKAQEEEKLKKEELKRIEREEKELEKERKKKLSTRKEAQSNIEVLQDVSEKTFKISGRILKGRYGVARIPVKLLYNGSANVFLTDKYGYYSIPDLEKDRDYVVTVVSDDNVLNISPKSRVYKKVNKDFTNHNYYVVTEK